MNKKEEITKMAKGLSASSNMFASPVPAHQYDFYLSDIGDETTMFDWFNTLRNATPYDNVVFHINSRGGELFTALQLLSAMRECHAHIECRLEGQCFSAATLIFLAGDSFIVNEHSQFMIHAYTTGVYGKRNEIHQSVEFQFSDFDEMFRKKYKHFLTKKEIEKVLAGKDIWLNAKEVVERLNSRQEKLNKKKNEGTSNDSSE